MLSFLSGGGRLGALIREHDWTSTSLGPPASWPQSLKTLVGVMLGSKHAMFVAWGPARIMLYNDGYAEILGAKHPGALGRTLTQVWAEVADNLNPLIEEVDAGRSVHMDDIRLVLQRNGYLEEAHFAFSYTPVRGEGGVIEGFFCPVMETTRQVLSTRALRDSEALAHQIFDSVTDHAIIVTDVEGRITRWNEGARRTFGWAEDEMLGETAERFFTPEDLRAGRLAVERRRRYSTS